MDSTPTTQKYTLESIAKRKQELLEEVRTQQQAMTNTTRAIFAPIAPATNKANALMQAFNTGMAVFDGVKLGVKLMRKVRTFFRAS